MVKTLQASTCINHSDTQSLQNFFFSRLLGKMGVSFEQNMHPY